MLNLRCPLLLLIILISASCNKADGSDGLSGKYMETSPAPGRCFLEFTAEGTLIRTERGSSVADVFTYSLTDSSIIIQPTWNAGYKPTALYFRRLSVKAFEIEYLYPVNASSKTPPPPPMIFEK